MVHRKDARDTSERRFGVASVACSVVGESSGQQAVRISNVVKSVRWNSCLNVFLAYKRPVRVWLSKALERVDRRRVSETAVKRRFEFDDESVVLPKGRGVYFDDPNFAIALRDEDKTVSSRRSGCSRRAAPVFQSSPR